MGQVDLMPFPSALWRQVSRVVFVAFLFVPTIAMALPRAGWVADQAFPNSFPVAADGGAAPVWVDPTDFVGVRRAVTDWSDDVERVCGRRPVVSSTATAPANTCVIVGTIGHSRMIDAMIAAGRLDVAAVRGQWESYVVRVVRDPLPGVSNALVIAGSDKRGTIFGVYDLSESMGVSPWYWWADVPVRRREAIHVRDLPVVQGPPAVRYRGIFINDEAPALSGWAKAKFGGPNSRMYTRVFELLLRLRANYLWPAMWGNAFNEDDPDNARLADEYGIVMGTSHQEPMLRAQAEFDRRYKPAQWNYATHPQLMEDFWRAGVRRNKNFESLITIGMRGRDDTPMIEGATVEQSMSLLETIVARQRQILAEEINPDVTHVPQVWCLYKEVQGYYEHGLRVPDDVTLLWADDNWGNLRRLPTAEERKRSGGAGIYYHFDYVGDPRNYKWINTNPLPKIQEQLQQAYALGADRIWIVNVGDIKPVELPIDFFMTMAWDPYAMTTNDVAAYTQAWAAREFGDAHADAIADVVSKYAKYNAWRKPELLGPETFSLINYGEAERVEAAWDTLVSQAEVIDAALPAGARDAYFELVLYPTQACATVTKLYFAVARNQLFTRQGRASAGSYAEAGRALFAMDQHLSDRFNHEIAGGKWDHMMDQTRIGYTGWQQPAKNVMPAVFDSDVPDTDAMGVSVEGSPAAWPGDTAAAVLPPFDTLSQQTRWVDVFRRGRRPFEVKVTADRPWVKLDFAGGTIDTDRRFTASIDWATVPAGRHVANVTLAASNGTRVDVKLNVVHDQAAPREAAGAFGSLTESVTVPADAGTSVPTGKASWQPVPDYGRVRAAMAIDPPTAASVTPPAESPRLEYPIYTTTAGEVSVKAVLGTSLAFVPGRGLRLAVSVDDGTPQVLDAAMTVMSRRDRVWADAVSTGVRVLSFTPRVSTPGRHTLKVWMVDPGVVVQSLVIGGPERPSYFGPPPARPIGSGVKNP